MNDNNIMLSVIMLAYNHEAYVAEAIESVLMQECDHAYELIIGEDNSPDNTREIVKKYAAEHPDRIRALLSEDNLGAIENELRCLQAAKGKYICFLEGDDFWVDKKKLQKQLDFLEANPDYGLAHGDVNHLEEESGKLSLNFNRKNGINIPQGAIFDQLILPSHIVKTMTVCLRKDLLDKHYLQDKEIMDQEWKLIDISIWLALAQHTKFHYFDEVFATYRLLPESMSRTKDSLKRYEFHKLIGKIREFFINKYEIDSQTLHNYKIYKHKAQLSDSFLVKDLNLANKAYFWLKTNKHLTFRQTIIYFSVKYSLIGFVVRKFIIIKSLINRVIRKHLFR